ncbi:MAG: PD-(D/E)XK nuclease superfamily protein [Candidatus Kapaibacteriales bacterium]
MGKGKQGNITGNQLESAVKTVFIGKGFQIVKYRDWKKSPAKFSEEVLLTNVPYTTIYNHSGSTEFLLISKKYNLTMRIECKWQQTSGSVDEKLPYLYLNAIESMPEDKIMILIDGKGWKKGAIEWLKDSVKNKKYVQGSSQKDILVFSLTEFFTWANKTFK